MADKSSSSRERTVSTEAGAKYFGLPIGSKITADAQDNAQGRRRPVTMIRLKSLQRQYIAAQRTGSKPMMAAVNRQFKQEMKIYMEVSGDTASDVLDSLDASPATGFMPSSELHDRDTADGNKPAQEDVAPTSTGPATGAPAGSAGS